MLVVAFGLLTLAVAGLLVYRLRAVPEGPTCPRCGATVAPELGAQGQVWYVLLGPDVHPGECPGCGWRGQIRCARAPELVAGTGLDGGEDA